MNILHMFELCARITNNFHIFSQWIYQAIFIQWNLFWSMLQYLNNEIWYNNHMLANIMSNFVNIIIFNKKN